MSNSYQRRKFIKTAAIAGCLGVFPDYSGLNFYSNLPDSELKMLSESLLKDWLEALLKLQIVNDKRPEFYGGIICPDKKIIHGRIGDAIYPMLYMAKHTKNKKYLKSAKLLYQWMETNVSMADGSWLNEPKKGSWKGTTVFAIIALAESLKHHADIIDINWRHQIEKRLIRAGEFVYQNFSLDYGNINYPINAAYALYLLGHLLNIERFKDKGTYFATEALKAFTPENFIAGEGALFNKNSEKGCFAVDLGYNVEESLPALVMYAQLANDDTVLQKVILAMQTHLEFMLPDGAWDNSWGTRNYKWTYWGSRTTDGSLAAYAFMAKKDKCFYKAALLNTQLLKKCTFEGLLYGGMHNHEAGILPSVHHTFCHAKSLTSYLDAHLDDSIYDFKEINLPRENTDNVKFFKDIQTLLIAKGDFKATISAYDVAYKDTKNGHATGGSLTMLWHQKVGPIITASMNEYQLFEADNMQQQSKIPTMCLTPRLEMQIDGELFTNICDGSAQVKFINHQDETMVTANGKLLNKNQENPSFGMIDFEIKYLIHSDYLKISYRVLPEGLPQPIKFILPLISSSKEYYTLENNVLEVQKAQNKLIISADAEIQVQKRVFNFVPGLEAIPVIISQPSGNIQIQIFE